MVSPLVKALRSSFFAVVPSQTAQSSFAARRIMSLNPYGWLAGIGAPDLTASAWLFESMP